MAGMDTIRARHSVREYTSEPIQGAELEALQAEVDAVRQASGLNIQLVMDNPQVFDVVASFGIISGCTSSIAFISKDKSDDMAIGYWGQRIALKAQELGLNTCWAALCARKKSKASVPPDGSKIRLVMAVGHGVNDGHERKTKPFGELATCLCDGPVPQWFRTAMEAAQLAPTGFNAQSFHITLLEDGKTVRAQAETRAWRQVDLGIVCYNFELAANACGADWRWEEPLV